MLGRKHTTVSIPRKLYENIEKRLEGSGFTSVSDYVTYVLRQVVSELERKDSDVLPKGKQTSTPSKDDEEEVKARLRSLGYLD
ncbi:CopG family transcriptional regulator [archaeon CG10_big_fil_rev_8_21_14_0_10_43_11]|nr:MAG: CopG family transcriptional regulator [archaeon CG10_big_fil_rev_8_21_14_0_10_43_11]